MSAQANIRNTLFDRKSPWYPEVSWILLINVKNMWVKKYPFVWEVCHHRPKLEIFSLTRSLHNHKSGFFQCCALINSFLFLKKTAPHYCVITGQNLEQDLWIEVLRPRPFNPWAQCFNSIIELKRCGHGPMRDPDISFWASYWSMGAALQFNH